MRWFKHLSMAHDDPALTEILEEFGAEGYGIYFLLLEHFAAVMEKDCNEVPGLTRSVQKWSQICNCSTRRFVGFVEKASILRLISSRTQAELKQNSSRTQAELKQNSSRTQADRLQICIPKLLKYRDEYSRKSGHAPESSSERDQSRSDTDTNPSVVPLSGNGNTHHLNGDAKADQPSNGASGKSQLTAKQKPWFAEWYGIYPRHEGKIAAEKSFARLVKTQEQFEKVMVALRAQLPILSAKEKQYIPHPATWMNQGRWEDEIETKEQNLCMTNGAMGAVTPVPPGPVAHLK